MPCPRCTGRSRAACGPPSIRRALNTRCRSGTSPTAYTSRAGWPSRCARCSTATSAPTGRCAAASPASGTQSTRSTMASELIATARRRAVQYATARGESPAFITLLRRALSPDALTIGFARRFATYKRANLLLQDLELLEALVNNAQMPVQLIFAGKAHPLDAPGKTVLQQVAQLTRDPRFLGKIVFVEDYDIDV